MKTVTVRDLRYHFSEIESHLREGEEVEIRKRRRAIARLMPLRPRPGTYPDFAARRKKLFGGRTMKVSAAQLMEEERGRY
jgi:antitoxin (DNA-binding transcriptional repressor) of toxin-antitoxin stability system